MMAKRMIVLQGGAVLTASPSTINSGDIVTVTWQGVLNPSDVDWIAYYAPVGMCVCVYRVQLLMCLQIHRSTSLSTSHGRPR